MRVRVETRPVGIHPLDSVLVSCPDKAMETHVEEVLDIAVHMLIPSYRGLRMLGRASRMEKVADPCSMRRKGDVVRAVLSITPT